MRRFFSLFLINITAILLFGIFIRFTPANDKLSIVFSSLRHKIDPPFIKSLEDKWVDSVFNSLSEEERIAQLMMIDVYPGRDENHFKEMEYLIEKYNPGGIIFFKGNPVQLAVLNNRLQESARTPLMTALDAEWGLNMRIDSTICYPKQMALGAIQDDRLIYDMGVHIARQLRRIGIHVNFAPVADVNNNPENPVINMRSFGENRVNVSKKSMLYLTGMQDNHVLAVAKHFPGHGDTDTDSHLALPVISHNRQRLDSIELFPFRELIFGGVGGIMMAHLNVPALDQEGLYASTLSPNITDSLLKKEMGFRGLVFTDAMNMGGISKQFKPVDANIKAIKAGNDILLMPGEIAKTIAAIQKEIKKGDISEEEINKRCKKVLAVKFWLGLSNYKPVKTDSLVSDLNLPEYKLLKEKLTEASITLVTNNNLLIPLRHPDTLKIASVTIGGNKNNNFYEYLNRYAPVANYYLSKESNELIIRKLYSELAAYNLVIVGIHETDSRASRDYGLTVNVVNFIDSVVTKNKVILNLFANPYALSYFKNLDRLDGLIVSYEDNELTQNLSAQLIFGSLSANGLLPVTGSKLFKEGSGFQTSHLGRLKYASPLEAGIHEKYLYKIDSIACDAIEKKAIPGCQVLAARNGIVFYQKSFGYHTYHNLQLVKNTDLYDIASVTKIVATMPALMKLHDQGLFDLNKNVSDYLEYLDTTNKKDISVKDILFHQSRLKAWIPFYINTLEPLYPNQNFSSNRLSDNYPIRIANNYYVNKHLKYKEGYFSCEYSENYSVKVADKLYLNNTFPDTIFHTIARSELNGTEGYRYSDLGFYWFYKIIEKLTEKSFESYLDSSFYKPLGAWSVCFNPLKHFDKESITPTENDLVFRRQVVHGYVHDMGAAMLGGVCGHAGIFSNANDLAKIMQMFLNSGEYGNVRYIDKATVKYFTSGQDSNNKNRRGIGFDKPEPDLTKNGPTSKLASPESYGHTGFTGTMVWADPACNVIYIFLSNRVYPEVSNNKLLEMNVRTQIQDVIYSSMISTN
ncbi:MAG: serine hydrolase [Bacteroidales bacterium]|nr:serine hydrolase [Bacteroidales bacterium]